MFDFERKMHGGGEAALHEAGRFLMRDDPVHQTLREMARDSDSLGGPHPVAGGLLRDLNIDMSAADIQEARREMWQGFPREDVA
jgi:hypothetical protein